MTISESIMKAAHAEIEAQPAVSDIEKAARAIVQGMGFTPDLQAFVGPAGMIKPNVYVVPMGPESLRPLWTFFMHEAECALNSVHK